MKKQQKWDYMGSGERERILGSGGARNAGKAINQRNRNSQLDDVMKEIKGTRKGR
jgi:hypothetical protein